MSWWQWLLIGIPIGGSAVALYLARQSINYAHEIHMQALDCYSKAIRRQQAAEWAEARAREWVA